MKNLKLMFIVVLEIVIILESMFPFVLLDENQWLYMLTMIPQVLAALIGFSFAGYQFYGSKLQNMALRDKSLTDTVSEAENELYKRLKYIAIVTSVNVLLCVIGIISYGDKYIFQ